MRAYRVERVSFGGADIEIAAWVYVPRGVGSHAAVVVVPGSAPLKAGFYDVWADRIARRGLIVVVPDKRGIGGTGGLFERDNNGSLKNLTLLATDVVAAVRYAARRTDVHQARVGIVGFSQAGWVGPIAAVQAPEIAFMAYVTAPTVSGREEHIWSDLRGDDRGNGTATRAQAEQVLDTVRAGGVDARSRLAQLGIPGFWQFGSEDNSIPTRRSVMVLDSLQQQGHPFEYDIVPGAGHLIVSRGRRTLIPSIVPESWAPLLTWLSARATS